jgi:PAS domain-containing protein
LERATGLLYNDAYAEILSAKHPRALGIRFHDIWSEIWPDISPLIQAALAGEASYREDLPLVVYRSGFSEQAWFTFSYSPYRDQGTGEAVRWFGSSTDIHDSKQAEEALQESERASG